LIGESLNGQYLCEAAAHSLPEIIQLIGWFEETDGLRASVTNEKVDGTSALSIHQVVSTPPTMSLQAMSGVVTVSTEMHLRTPSDAADHPAGQAATQAGKID
jgi:hypothetical protein